MKNIIGIDVGINGCIALYDGDELLLWDMPVVERNKTRRIDCLKINSIFEGIHHDVDHVFIEQVNAFGMGATSAYNFGWNCGIIEMVVSGWELPFSYVTPQIWKKQMQCPSEKNAARMRASQLLPKYAHNWDLKKHDGRAEASLIALYGFNRF